MRMNSTRLLGRIFLCLFFAVAGLNHFISPATYLSIMPPYLPAPLTLVYLSGAAELIGGVAILIPFFRIPAGWGLILLLVAVFPANIYALQNGMAIGGQPVTRWMLVLRLPLQLLFIYWVYWSCLTKIRNAEHQR